MTSQTAKDGEMVEVRFKDGTRKLRTFPQLSPEAFQHPDDRDAIGALQAIPVLPSLLKKYNEYSGDQLLRMQNLADNIRLGPHLGADLYEKFVLACRILDVHPLPELYVTGKPVVNAYAAGCTRPVVMLEAGLISRLNEDELLAVIGHELGHIKCGHILYGSLGQMFKGGGVGLVASVVPIAGNAVYAAAEFAFSHWNRMAEFSCDRAGLLVVQDPEVAARVDAKLAGFGESIIPDFNFEPILEQLVEYDRYNEEIVGLYNKVNFFLGGRGLRSHPMSVLRIKRILEWGKSDQYKDILAGNYPRSTGRPTGAFLDDSAPRCSHCGQVNALGSTFCSQCGHRL